MRKIISSVAVTAALLLAGMTLLQTPAHSQAPTDPASTRRGKIGKGKGKGGPPVPAKHRPDGTIDLSGIYSGGGSVGDITTALTSHDALPMLPSAEATLKARRSKDDPEANCLPTGVPRVAPYPWRIVQTDTHIFFLFEGNIHSYRQIFIDGRDFPPPDDLDPTWYGYSIGHFEGDTLVVETKGYNDKFWFDFQGHPHTDQMTTVERYTRMPDGNLDVQTTVTDPGAYSEPFTVEFTARATPGEELMEYICQENNQDVDHIKGPASEF